MHSMKKSKTLIFFLIISLLMTSSISILFAEDASEANKGITRLEFFKAVNASFGFTEASDKEYKDLTKDDESYEEIRKAVAAGYVQGYTDGTIRPEKFITRQEAAKIAAVACGLNNELSNSASGFADADEIDEWARNYVGIVKDRLIMTAFEDGTFGPQKHITAVEADEIIKKAKAQATKAEDAVAGIKADYHMHMMSGEFSKIFKVLMGGDTSNGNLIEEYSGEKIISLLDSANIDAAFVVSNSYILGMDGIAGKDEYDDVKKENNYVAIQTAKYPDRLIGFFSFNPLKEYAEEEMERCYNELKLPGLKLHFTNSDVDLTNPEHLMKIQKLFKSAADKNIPILLHFRSRSPEFGKKDAEILIDEVIEKIPNLKLQIAHLGGWGGFDDAAVQVFSTFIEKYEKNPSLNKSNIYFDFSGVVVTEKERMEGVLEPITEEQADEIAEMMRKWGLSNMVVGSDWPFVVPKDYVDNVKKLLPLTEEELNTILSNDSAKVLFEKSMDNGVIKHPNLEELNKKFKDGVDYNTSFSIKF